MSKNPLPDESTPTVQPASSPLGRLLLSDSLPAWVGLAKAVSALSPSLEGFVKFHLLLDANILQGELRWRLGRRQKTCARTGLHEAIIAGVLIAYAPAFLEEEILDHVGDIAFGTKSTAADVRREWKELRPLVHFYKPGEEPPAVNSFADKDDLPYVAARSQLGLRAIYTNDRHLERMGAPVVKDQIDISLRDYARASTVKIGITVGSSIAFALSTEAIPALYRLLKTGVSWIRQRSTMTQLAIIGIALALAIHPKSRAKFSEAWHLIAPAMSDAVRAAVIQLLCDYAGAMQNAESSLHALESAIPRQGKRTALMRARTVCLVKSRPLTLQQIVESMREEGYKSNSPYATAYLRRILRNAKEFVEISPGKWVLKTE